MNPNWLASATNRYEACMRSMLELMLARPPLKGAFIDTKIHSITGENHKAVGPSNRLSCFSGEQKSAKPILTTRPHRSWTLAGLLDQGSPHQPDIHAPVRCVF